MLSKGEAAALLSLINAHHATLSGMMFSLTLFIRNCVRISRR